VEKIGFCLLMTLTFLFGTLKVHAQESLDAGEIANEIKSFKRSVLSAIYGSRALNEIIDIPKWQSLLNINATDLESLRTLRLGDEIDLELRKHLDAKGPHALQDIGRLREKLIRERMVEILDPNQVTLRRVHFLREKYSWPTSVFNRNSTLLIELGMSQNQFSTAGISAAMQKKQLMSQILDLLKQSLDSVAKQLSEEKSKRLWSLFGTDFQSRPRSDLPWSEIQVLQYTDPREQMLDSVIIALDEDLALSQDQRRLLILLDEKERANFGRDRSVEISAELDKILSAAQRSAIVQDMQRGKLFADMNVVLERGVITYVGINEAELNVIRPLISEAVKTIRDRRIRLEMDVVMAESKKMPNEFQEKLSELLDGVWE